MPHFGKEAHFWWVVGEVLREPQLCLEKAALAAEKAGEQRGDMQGVARVKIGAIVARHLLSAPAA
jgi:hypothetical protein